jgi:hypothetical protein
MMDYKKNNMNKSNKRVMGEGKRDGNQKGKSKSDKRSFTSLTLTMTTPFYDLRQDVAHVSNIPTTTPNSMAASLRWPMLTATCIHVPIFDCVAFSALRESFLCFLLGLCTMFCLPL